MVNIKTFTIDLNKMKLLIQQKVTEFEVEAMGKVFSESQKKSETSSRIHRVIVYKTEISYKRGINEEIKNFYKSLSKE